MPTYTGSDIYCDLIIPKRSDGNIDVEVVHETRHILVIKHTKPYWEHHLVVVPKHHVDSLLTLNLQSVLAYDLLTTVRKMADQVTKEHGSCRVLTNLGDYQDSKHLHIHLSSGKLTIKP